jgi:hypothetical protein
MPDVAPVMITVFPANCFSAIVLFPVSSYLLVLFTDDILTVQTQKVDYYPLDRFFKPSAA